MKLPVDLKIKNVMLGQDAAKQMILDVIDHLADWPIPSAEAFRNAVLGDGFMSINPMLGIEDERSMHFLGEQIRTAIAEGRMIDFGFIPNVVLKEESLRSRTLFEAGELPQPYDDWVAISRWEGGMCGYFFASRADHPGHLLCMELYGVRMQPSKRDMILIYDIVSIAVEDVGQTRVIPAKLIIDDANNDEAGLSARGANCLDPLVCMLAMLSDASIPVVDHPTPTKLNLQRARQGKHPIPAHAVVQARDYVSTFQPTRSAKGPALGGHHASPAAHSRRAHIRHLKTGKIVPVRSSKVNWRTSEELHRLFYRIPRS